MNSLANRIYKFPTRHKFLLASVAIFIFSTAFANYIINWANRVITDEQYYEYVRKPITTLSKNILNQHDGHKLAQLFDFNYIEKIIITRNRQILYAYDSNHYEWYELDHLSVDRRDASDTIEIHIAINKHAFFADSKKRFKKYQYANALIISVLWLFFLIIANYFLIRPIEKVTVAISDYDYEEDESDDKSKSQIIELNKTISLLKNNIQLVKNKENELNQVRERLYAVLNTVGDAIITINKKGSIVMVNKAFETIWGYSKEEIMGQDLTRLMPEKYRELHTNGMNRYLNTGIEQVLNQNIEIEALNSNDEIFPIEIHIAETKVNNELFFTAAVKDITQRKKIETELIESKENVEEKLQEKTTDLRRKINELKCFYGFSRLTNTDSDDINFVLKETVELIHTAFEDPEEIFCCIVLDLNEYKTKGFFHSSHYIQSPIKLKNSRRAYIKICCRCERRFQTHEIQLINAMSTRIKHYIEVIQSKQALEDANEILRNTQLQLIQAEKMDTIGILSAGVAHEVKNPLAVIQLGIDYLKRKVDDEQIGQVIHEIDDAIYRADSVIKQLVDFSASNELNFDNANINHLIDESLNLVKHEIMTSNITIIKQFDETCPSILIDRQKITQVIINIIINSIHAMEDSDRKEITIHTRHCKAEGVDLDRSTPFSEHDEIIEIAIEDSGTGIDENALKTIFEPFYTTKPSGKGTGLGLTVCQNIIWLHGGNIHYSNTGNGTRATLFLKSRIE